jgi:hypothetical protein
MDSRIPGSAKRERVNCGNLFRDDDTTAAEGLVRSCIEGKYDACKLMWSIVILKPGPIFVAYRTDEDRF